ncbi:MAG: hypothetical protein JSS60_00720 [Verrucomicrobia bacterium]|nr:hypothetical protein [Verrucomicrobiota bacterium]
MGLSLPLCAMQISTDEADAIGKGVFYNECSGKEDRLVWWNEGENFPSLGIGHFIWYPKGVVGPFEETFPKLMAFLKENDVKLPGWLKAEEGCPWSDKEAFLAEGAKRKELQELLVKTMALQAVFIGKRFEAALPRILSTMGEEKRERALKQIARLENSSQGKFALIDYVNFKGDGTSDSERYAGKGWGLRQVLEEMPENPENPLAAFTAAAKAVLRQRVESAPPERHEERWLPGWLSRVDRYLKS